MWHELGDGMRFGMVDPGWFFLAGFFKVLWFVFLIAAIFGLFRLIKRSRHMAWQKTGWQGKRNWQDTGEHGRRNWQEVGEQGRRVWQEAKDMFGGQGKTWGTPDDALQTARTRLAKGELTPEEFADLKTQLEIANEPDPALKIARQRFANGEIGAEEFKMIQEALR